MQTLIERREQTTFGIELRADEGASGPVVSGYAAVFNSLSEKLYEPERGWFREMVMPGTFRKTIAEQNIPLLIEHGGLPLGTTGADTLTLREDERGLYFESVLDASDPDVQKLLPKIRRRDMARCSFSFLPVREDPLDIKTKPPTRRLREVRLFDVSIVARPAYGMTEAKVRKAMVDQVLAEDGLDAECISELLVRLRMGLPLEDEETETLRRLAVTLNRFMPEGEALTPALSRGERGSGEALTPALSQGERGSGEALTPALSRGERGKEGATTAQSDGPVPGEPPEAREQPVMATGEPGQTIHPLSWYRERLARMGV